MAQKSEKYRGKTEDQRRRSTQGSKPRTPKTKPKSVGSNAARTRRVKEVHATYGGEKIAGVGSGYRKVKTSTTREIRVPKRKPTTVKIKRGEPRFRTSTRAIGANVPGSAVYRELSKTNVAKRDQKMKSTSAALKNRNKRVSNTSKIKYGKR